jgi:hypothetical protein
MCTKGEPTAWPQMLAASNAQIELCALELRGVGADVAVLTPMERLVLDQ